MIEKVIRLNGEVINIGDWDFNRVPVGNPIPVNKMEEEYLNKLEERGLDPTFLYDDNFNLITKATNPIPEGATIAEEEVVVKESGARILAVDYAKLREYPSVGDQLDYIYHYGIDAWKEDMIKPIKDEYPKPS